MYPLEIVDIKGLVRAIDDCNKDQGRWSFKENESNLGAAGGWGILVRQEFLSNKNDCITTDGAQIELCAVST